jgi:hypothetical protein
METIEMIKDLIQLPFDILNAAQGESKVGYAILMILFGSALLTAFYFVLDFVQKVFKYILQFLTTSFESFTSIFKRKAKPTPCSFGGFDTNNQLQENIFNESMTEINNKLDNLIKDSRTKDIL